MHVHVDVAVDGNVDVRDGEYVSALVHVMYTSITCKARRTS